MHLTHCITSDGFNDHASANKNFRSLFGTLIAVRLTIKRDSSKLGSWKHEKSADNLAGVCSRGMTNQGDFGLGAMLLSKNVLSKFVMDIPKTILLTLRRLVKISSVF